MKKQPVFFATVLLAVFAGLIFFFVKGLGNDPRALDNTAVGKSTAQLQFSLPTLEGDALLTADDMPEPPYLLNVWGSWCPACYTEHPYLMRLGQEIPIIGLNWPADNPDENRDARQFLHRYGNPYRHIISDEQGVLIIELGVYGAPETFLIGADGRILHRYAGPLNAAVWQQQFLPLIENRP